MNKNYLSSELYTLAKKYDKSPALSETVLRLLRDSSWLKSHAPHMLEVRKYLNFSAQKKDNGKRVLMPPLAMIAHLLDTPLVEDIKIDDNFLIVLPPACDFSFENKNGAEFKLRYASLNYLFFSVHFDGVELEKVSLNLNQFEEKTANLLKTIIFYFNNSNEVEKIPIASPEAKKKQKKPLFRSLTMPENQKIMSQWLVSGHIRRQPYGSRKKPKYKMKFINSQVRKRQK